MKVYKIIVLACLVVIGIFTSVGTVYAVEPTDPLSIACSKEPDSEICKKRSENNGNQISGANGIIIKAANIVAIITGIAATIMVILAGIRYVTSQGDPKSVAAAKDQIIYTMVGVTIIVVARSIIVFVINKL